MSGCRKSSFKSELLLSSKYMSFPPVRFNYKSKSNKNVHAFIPITCGKNVHHWALLVTFLTILLFANM
ncbi:conserved hypothetical protein [Listeria monocytogenes]|nr:conserved hypothetical protein [Listeria monocytogenes]CUL94343.1 conserved hypothetical protein [Listeria monocytogenes]